MALHIDPHNKKILTEKEFNENVKWNWITGLFFIGFIIGGWAAYEAIALTQLIDYPKWLRFILVLISGIFLGVILAKLRKVLLLGVGFIFIIGMIGGIGYLIWSLI